MNKEEVLKLAEDIDADFYPSTEESLTIFTNDQLLAFANACEKIGMEKAAKICADVSFDRINQGNHIGFNAIHECIDAIHKAI